MQLNLSSTQWIIIIFLAVIGFSATVGIVMNIIFADWSSSEKNKVHLTYSHSTMGLKFTKVKEEKSKKEEKLDPKKQAKRSKYWHLKKLFSLLF